MNLLFPLDRFNDYRIVPGGCLVDFGPFNKGLTTWLISEPGKLVCFLQSHKKASPIFIGVTNCAELFGKIQRCPNMYGSAVSKIVMLGNSIVRAIFFLSLNRLSIVCRT